MASLVASHLLQRDFKKIPFAAWNVPFLLRWRDRQQGGGVSVVQAPDHYGAIDVHSCTVCGSYGDLAFLTGEPEAPTGRLIESPTGRCQLVRA